jgi:hypothetical protein
VRALNRRTLISSLISRSSGFAAADGSAPSISIVILARGDAAVQGWAGPESRMCGCRPHSEPLRSAMCRCSLTASSGSRGADQSTRPLGQAKEPRARPMRSGDAFGNHRQRAIMPAFIFEPVLANENGVRVSAPLAH